MTNLLAFVIFTVSTNWVTISTTYPKCNTPGCLVYHMPMLNMVGTIYSNKVFVVDWEGKKVETVVESKEIGTIKKDEAEEFILKYK